MGLYLSMLGIYGIGRRLGIPNAVNIILSIALLYCYGTMVGMGVSIIRALVMFGMKLSASLLKRTYDMLTAMMTAALLILVQQPLYLTHSGFLFSFGAICVIGFLPAVSACFPFRYRPVKALVAGLWVAVFTLSVHLCVYYQFPPYSIFLNLLVIPCMRAVLLSGIAAVAARALSLSLGHIAVFFRLIALAVFLSRKGENRSLRRGLFWRWRCYACGLRRVWRSQCLM